MPILADIRSLWPRADRKARVRCCNCCTLGREGRRAVLSGGRPLHVASIANGREHWV